MILVASSGASKESIRAYEAEQKGVRFLPVWGGAVPIPGIEYSHLGLELSKETKQEILEFNPDVVHVSNPDPTAGLVRPPSPVPLLAAIQPAHLSCAALYPRQLVQWLDREHVEIPLIATLHSHYAELVNFYDWTFLKTMLAMGMGLIYDNIPTTFMPSQSAIDKTLGYGWNTDFRIWGRGVDSELLNPRNRSMEWRRSNGVEDDDFCIMWIARLVPDKRPLLWGDCVQKLADEVLKGPTPKRKVKGLCVGKGPDHIINGLKAHPAVNYLGFKSGEELSTAFASGDVLLFPSEIETFGRVTLEASASGCPAIVDAGCGSHLVTDGVNGFTVPTGSGVEEFLVPLRKLYADEKLRLRLGSKAREMSLSHSAQGMVDDMEQNYRTAMVEQRGRKARNKAPTLLMNPFLWRGVYYVLGVMKVITVLLILAREGRAATAKPEVKFFMEEQLMSFLAYCALVLACLVAYLWWT